MKKSIAWILAALLLLAAWGTMAEEEGKLEPLFATVGDALAAAGENPVAGGEEEYYAVVTAQEGRYYRSVALLDEKAKALQEAISAADFEHLEEAFAAMNDYIATLPIAYSEVFTAAPMEQAELDALVGKTIGELREQGYEDRECGTDVDENEQMIIAYVLCNGLYDYRFVVDADFDTYEKAQEGELDDGAFVVKSANLRGITGEACSLRFHTDGTIEEPEDMFDTFSEMLTVIQEMIEGVKSGEIDDIDGFLAGLKEQYPDMADVLDAYREMIDAIGWEQFSALMTPAE